MAERKAGRPPGRSAKGRAREAALYETALRLFAEQGYEATTLRQIAQAAGVSAGLMYRYFGGKQAVVLRLYTELSTTYSARVGAVPQPWAAGVAEALAESLAVLGPHRSLLQSLMGVLVSPGEGGIFSEATRDARRRVMDAFERAVCTAPDAPGTGLRLPLARL
ncbi:MAG TPA: TetR/AcrR family transcriptional regulator, partial [Deltaproteobacteria bacterium]|nr:TetR/AcrR family transcriptional regulator [Deltaproteobacteria bacterium]